MQLALRSPNRARLSFIYFWLFFFFLYESCAHSGPSMPDAGLIVSDTISHSVQALRLLHTYAEDGEQPYTVLHVSPHDIHTG